MSCLPSLPSNLCRRSIVAWCAITELQRRGDKYVKATELQPLWPADDAKDYECCESDNQRTEVSVIPALKDTFLIEQELKDGSLAKLCFEINGIFTDYAFNNLMQKHQGCTFRDDVIYNPEDGNLYRVNKDGIAVERV
jgi:hypothetical protein